MIAFRQNSTLICGFGLFLAAAVFVFPIWLYGIPQSHDTIHHLQTANALYEIITSGEIFPVWAADQNNGYGSVVLRLYPPISYIVLAVGKMIGGNWYNAGCLAFLWWTFTGGLGAFFFARQWFSAQSSFVAALLFIFAPYHAIQLYSAFLYAEFAAVSLLPFCFLFITRICRTSKVGDVLGFGIFYALLVMTHLPLALIGSICFGFYFLFCPKLNSHAKSFAGFIAGIFTGLAASSFQWIRVLLEMNFVGISTEKYSAYGFYDYRENFLLSFPYLKGFEVDAHHLWFLDLALILTLLFVIPFAALFYRKAGGEMKLKLRGVFSTCVLSFFMLTLLSYPLWQNFSLLQKVQFPWRWFGVFSALAVVFVAAGFEHLREMAEPKTRPIFLLLIGTLIIGVTFTAAQVIRQAVYISEQNLLAVTEKLSLHSDLEEWLPVWTNRKTAAVKEKFLSERHTEIISWLPTEKSFAVGAGAETEVRVAVFYYPHWAAAINGKPVAVKPSADGAVSIRIPGNESFVSLKFIETPTIIWAFYLTVAVWLTIILFGLWNILSKSKI